MKVETVRLARWVMYLLALIIASAGWLLLKEFAD
jgi:hypothetical protein